MEHPLLARLERILRTHLLETRKVHEDLWLGLKGTCSKVLYTISKSLISCYFVCSVLRKKSNVS
jgi:hypothetical protein